MKSLTLFRAYREARNRMSYAIENRQLRSFSIAVDCDKNARIWQKYNRLAAKIDHRFHGLKACYSCSGSSFHFDDCKRENKMDMIGARELE